MPQALSLPEMTMHTHGTVRRNVPGQDPQSITLCTNFGVGKGERKAFGQILYGKGELSDGLCRQILDKPVDPDTVGLMDADGPDT